MPAYNDSDKSGEASRIRSATRARKAPSLSRAAAIGIAAAFARLAGANLANGFSGVGISAAGSLPSASDASSTTRWRTESGSATVSRSASPALTWPHLLFWSTAGVPGRADLRRLPKEYPPLLKVGPPSRVSDLTARARIRHDAGVVIPIHDGNPVRRPTVVTFGLIAANVLVFLTSPAAFAGPNPGDRQKAAETAYLYQYGAIPKVLLSGHSNPVWPVLTAMFVHAGWVHLLGNMLFLYIFGNNVEDEFGRVHFALFYLLAGTASTYAYALTNPQATGPLVGASGAIAAVLGAYVYMFPQARVT